MKKFGRNLFRFILTILLAAGVTGAFWNFIRDNRARIDGQNEEYLQELTVQRAISIDNLFEENLNFIQSTAFLYGKSLNSAQADVDLILEFEQNAIFDRLIFIDASGDDYTSKGVMANLSDREYYQNGMRGMSDIVYVERSRVTNQSQIGFYAPVWYEEQIIGVLVGFYGEAYIRELLEYELFAYSGEGWLCAADGTVLGSTVDTGVENYLSWLREQGCTEEELGSVQDAFAAGEDTTVTFEEADGTAIGYAVGLELPDWYLIRTFPPSASAQIMKNANREGMLLIAELIVMFAVYGLLWLVGFLAEKRKMREENRHATDISTGVSRLFTRFATLDMDTAACEYIGGIPDSTAREWSGSYEVLCQSILERVPEEEEERREQTAGLLRLENLKQVLAESDVFSLRIHAPEKRDEWFTYNFIVLERKEREPKRVLIVRQDVTELHEKEREEQQKLQEALQTAESASRAKTEFLFNMSHDIRTPMNAIIGYTELAQREGVSEQEMREYIRKIDSSSEHLLSLINDILEMSRIESGKITLEPEETDLLDLMSDVRELFAAQMQNRRIRYTVETDTVRDSRVICDKNRLDRILLNLVGNACKFTPEGGEVSVRLLQEEAGDGTEQGCGRYVLRVKDNGIGMSPEFVSRLFHPFERERTSTVSGTQGTGLGLSITKNFVDMMGGTIRVETAQGKGTEFIVSLQFPVCAGEAGAETNGTAEDEVDFRGMRLLLAEDNAINREIATLILSQAGFQLETAENGQLAVECIAGSEPGYFDAVLMDIQMPVMNGYEAAAAIRALDDRQLAGIPIIAMTANAFQEDIRAAQEAGMNGHIAKPLDVDRMLGTLRRVLGGQHRE